MAAKKPGRGRATASEKARRPTPPKRRVSVPEPSEELASTPERRCLCERRRPTEGARGRVGRFGRRARRVQEVLRRHARGQRYRLCAHPPP